jgi:hypothetical protein
MAEIIHNTDHVAEALARILERYKEKPNFQAFLTSFVTGLQEIEDAAIDWNDNRWIEDASGVQLDEIGHTVGQSRLGYSDDLYRVLILVKIAINNSQGDPVAIKAIFKLITGADVCHFQRLDVCSISLMSDGADPTGDPDFLYDNIQRAILAGVALDTLGFYADPGPSFLFGPSTHPDIPSAGFGSGKFPTLLRRS